MVVLLVILIALAVVLVGVLGFVATRHRGRGAGSAPPAARRATGPDGASDTAVLDRPVADDTVVDEPVVPEAPPVDELVAPSFLDRLGKARRAIGGYFGSILSRSIDDETWEEIEEALISADVGVATTSQLIERLRERAAEAGTTESAELLDILKAEMKAELASGDRSLSIGEAPSVWLFVGVNGVGKTTTIGKLAHREIVDGRTVVLAAGDTFRAAAAEQLEMWAQRSGAGFIRGSEGGDPGSVVFDAIDHARARGAVLVMADTAGRLHTNTNLMEELSKVRRVAEKGAGSVAEVLLVIDATTGQNGLVQARQFADAVDVSGVVLTKLDGSAKGGIVFAVQSELGIPVKLVGLGEGIGDLVEFDADDFVDALFA
ncbi:MAG: signal recognition particle-docking protein FtsY [Acidimicrobiales bacterium]